MSTEDIKSPSGLPISGSIVALALLLGLGLVSQISFHPSRPQQPLQIEEGPLKGENIQARLWQDPFAAVARHEKRFPGKTDCEIQERNRLFSENILADAKKIIVLGVMVFGGPYPADVEMRTRYRYAVLSALGRLDYAPEDERHLGCLHNLLQEDGGPKVIPYEWFKLPTDPGQKILVLWLKDESFLSRPLMYLRKLNSRLRKWGQQRTGDQNTIPERGLKILGPASSGTLSVMLHEKVGGECETPAPQSDMVHTGVLQENAGRECEHGTSTVDLEIYSWGATAEFENDFSEKHPNVHFVRTIATDGILIDAILEELRLRDAYPLPEVALGATEWREPASIALISEWDSHYGRKLPETFVKKVVARYNKTFPQEIHKRDITWIYPFSYMRGLDGLLPDHATSRPSSGTAKEQSEKEEKAETIERPVGNSQFDYLRRLARQLSELDNQIRGGGGRGIRAIGVLGGDVYDKMLVLQAMYRLFPDVVFFTTDLDARLLHPGELKWTRNLVVASCFGLRLHRKLQKNIPPFRDGYQTSLFFSTLLALSNNPRGLNTKKITEWLGPPRVFEVGKNGAYDLGGELKYPPGDIQISFPSREPVVLKEWVHPSSVKGFDVMRFLWVVGAGLFFIGICLSLYYRSDGREEMKIPWEILAVLAYPLLVAGVLYLIILFQDARTREPLSLMEGISIWPTEFLRLLIAGLTFYFLITVCRKTRESYEILSGYFVSEDDSADADESDEKKPFKAVWDSYSQECSRRKRWKRIFLLSGSYFILCLAIIKSFTPPSAPFRGPASWYVDVITILVFCVPLFIILIFWVVDATKQAVWLIRGLVTIERDWPKAKKKQFPEVSRVSPEVLNEWIYIRMIVDLTKSVNRFVYYPFIIILLLGVSRLRYFDKWHLPTGLLLVMLLGLALSLYCAITLRRTAEQTRQKVLDKLWMAQLEAKTSEGDDKGLSTRIGMIRGHVKDIREGALAPFLEQPWVRALALFVSGSGSLVLLQFLP